MAGIIIATGALVLAGATLWLLLVLRRSVIEAFSKYAGHVNESHSRIDRAEKHTARVERELRRLPAAPPDHAARYRFTDGAHEWRDGDKISLPLKVTWPEYVPPTCPDCESEELRTLTGSTSRTVVTKPCDAHQTEELR